MRETFLPGELEHAVTGFRTEGRADAAGRGAVVEDRPFGGSVIEGYHHAMTVVLDEAVVEAEDDGEVPDAPTTVRIWCVDPALRAALEACVCTDAG